MAIGGFTGKSVTATLLAEFATSCRCRFFWNLSSPDLWLTGIIGSPKSLGTVLPAFLLNPLPFRVHEANMGTINPSEGLHYRHYYDFDEVAYTFQVEHVQVQTKVEVQIALIRSQQEEVDRVIIFYASKKAKNYQWEPAGSVAISKKPLMFSVYSCNCFGISVQKKDKAQAKKHRPKLSCVWQGWPRHSLLLLQWRANAWTSWQNLELDIVVFVVQLAINIHNPSDLMTLTTGRDW
nr:hypothetical protein [Tanacetum cinerariifolium]